MKPIGLTDNQKNTQALGKSSADFTNHRILPGPIFWCLGAGDK
jgi:hypothetical protein